jgi:hypothetical protein
MQDTNALASFACAGRIIGFRIVKSLPSIGLVSGACDPVTPMGRWYNPKADHQACYPGEPSIPFDRAGQSIISARKRVLARGTCQGG